MPVRPSKRHAERKFRFLQRPSMCSRANLTPLSFVGLVSKLTNKAARRLSLRGAAQGLSGRQATRQSESEAGLSITAGRSRAIVV